MKLVNAQNNFHGSHHGSVLWLSLLTVFHTVIQRSDCRCLLTAMIAAAGKLIFSHSSNNSNMCDHRDHIIQLKVLKPQNIMWSPITVTLFIQYVFLLVCIEFSTFIMLHNDMFSVWLYCLIFKHWGTTTKERSLISESQVVRGWWYRQQSKWKLLHWTDGNKEAGL